MTNQEIETIAKLCKALSDPTRLRILLLLTTRTLCVNAIVGCLDISQPAVSQHLKILKQVGLVRSERKGYWIPYSIDEGALENCGQLLNEICTCGCKGTGQFKETVLMNSKLENLKDYEKELIKELGNVRDRIKEIESQSE